MRFADVIVSINHKDVDKVFQYSVPAEMAAEYPLQGRRVLVPFGNGNKLIEGAVIGLSETASYDEKRIKPLVSFLDDFPIFTPVTVELAKWMKIKYYTTLSDALSCIMPSGIAMKNAFIAVPADIEPQNLKGKQKEVYAYIRNNRNVAERELKEQFGDDVSKILKPLCEKGLITLKQTHTVKDYALRIKYVYTNGTATENGANVTEKQAEILSLIADSPMALSDLKAYLRISDSPIKTLEKNGFIRIETVEARRSVVHSPLKEGCPKGGVVVHTPEQAAAVGTLIAALDAPVKNPFLIHGVTGSGKTEIYMTLIEEAVKRGGQAIMLVPEISLTPQAVETFTARFGDNVTVTHSRLSLGERFDQWKKAIDGQVNVIIGPRSAVFTPFSNLKVIIIDEEHENTYKSETSPKYYIKEVAEKLSEITGCMVVMGSATPSVSTYYETQTNRITLIKLNERVNKTPPDIEIVDMRSELALGNRSVFSIGLKAAIEENLGNKMQSILFLNRRGHSTFVSCRSCGYVMECENCCVNYTYHIYSNKLLCHYCNKHEQHPENCPVCNSKYIRFFGAGTQKIEEELKNTFPSANILRMDMDTTSTKNAHARIITAFAEGKADILVGTQMIAKGLNFPNVSLVGIIAADTALNAGDFRCAETAYQLITQVSGRAGRASARGKAYIQTYCPEHYSIKYAKNNDYESFYKHEIAIRKQMCYPPFSHIFMLLFTGTDERKVITTLNKLLGIMQAYNKKQQFEMLGPAPAVVSKINRNYRWKLLVKCVDEDKIKGFVLYCMDKLRKSEDMDGITCNLTLNPTMIN
jgi:primosomal protein N' (replication factor Y)